MLKSATADRSQLVRALLGVMALIACAIQPLVKAINGPPVHAEAVHDQ